MAQIRADMAANVWKVVVTEGDQVTAGDVLVVLESMKMEIPIEAPADGVVRLSVAEGQSIDEDDLIATVD